MLKFFKSVVYTWHTGQSCLTIECKAQCFQYVYNTGKLGCLQTVQVCDDIVYIKYEKKTALKNEAVNQRLVNF